MTQSPFANTLHSHSALLGTGLNVTLFPCSPFSPYVNHAWQGCKSGEAQHIRPLFVLFLCLAHSSRTNVSPVVACASNSSLGENKSVPEAVLIT